MIDNHLGNAQHQDARSAYFAASNQSNGQAFHGIDSNYYTAGQRLLRGALWVIGVAGFVAYCVWAYHHNMTHLS